MPTRSSLNVSLSSELEEFVQRRVATGRYQTASEVVREGLRLLEAQEKQREAVLKTIKAKLDRGAAQADRGELVDPNRLLKRIAVQKKRRARAVK